MTEYRILTEFPDPLLCDAAELYLGARWLAPGESAAFLRPALTGSGAVAGAFDGEKLIGIGRALTDGVSDAYIQDVTVAAAYRKQGIGSELVRLLIRTLRARGVDWIALAGEPGTESFYGNMGCFERRNGYTLWQYRENGTEPEK